MIVYFLLILCSIGIQGRYIDHLNKISHQWKEVDTDFSEIHTFTLALQPNLEGLAMLEKFVLTELSNIKSPHHGHYLTIDEINKMTQAPQEIRFNLIELLHNEDIHCEDMFDALRCKGKIETIDSVFSTELRNYRVNFQKSKRTVRTSFKAYSIPERFENVLFIDGLSNPLPLLRNSKKNVEAHSIVDPGSVSREVLERMYNLYPTFVGPDVNVSVGAVEYEDMSDTDGFNNKSMIESQIGNGIPVNPISLEHLVGNNSVVSDGESDLDVQVMYWAASDAQLWYETEDFWMYEWAVSFLNRPNVPEVVSISWGWDETDQCGITNCSSTDSQTYVSTTNAQFLKIVARGVTIVVASGDAGSPGRSNEDCASNNTEYGWNHINADFPGGSPWVLSVGATYVVASNVTFDYTTPICTKTPKIKCANGLFEQGTTLYMTGWTSGAAFDHWDQTPSWQIQEVSAYLNSGVELPDPQYFNAKGRSTPDVSTFGHNCITKNTAGWGNSDGTSCSAPIMAGIIANLNGFFKSLKGDTSVSLGFVNQLIYMMGRELPSTFNDVLVANTSCTEESCCGPQYGFIATKGWDAATGWGTPNVEQMKEYIISNVQK